MLHIARPRHVVVAASVRSWLAGKQREGSAAEGLQGTGDDDDERAMMAARAAADEAGGASTPTRALKRRPQRLSSSTPPPTSKRLTFIGEKRQTGDWFF